MSLGPRGAAAPSPDPSPHLGLLMHPLLSHGRGVCLRAQLRPKTGSKSQFLNYGREVCFRAQLWPDRLKLKYRVHVPCETGVLEINAHRTPINLQGVGPWMSPNHIPHSRVGWADTLNKNKPVQWPLTEG